MNTIAKIRAEIERLKGDIGLGLNEYDTGFENGKCEICNHILSFLYTLQEPEVGEEYALQIGKETHILRVGSRADIDRLIRQEEPQVDLEEAAENYIAPIENEDGLKVINFSGQDIKDDFIEGAEWQKAKMMEGAVEGVVMDFSSNQPRPQVDVLLDPHKYHTGDKVKIIIVKED